MTVGELRELVSVYPDDFIIIGQCLTPENIWLNYPVSVGKALGDNSLVIIQLRPQDESNER